MCTWLPLFLMAVSSLLGWLIGRTRKFDTSDFDRIIASQKLSISNLESKKKATADEFTELDQKYTSLNSQYQTALNDLKSATQSEVEIKEVIQEVVKEVEVIKEVPVQVIKEVEVIKHVELIKEIEVIKPVEVVKEVTVEKIVEKIVEIEVVKEVPVEVIKEVEVIREVEIIKEVPVSTEVEIIKEVEVVKEVPVEIIVEKEIIKEVVKEVPVEVVREVEVIKEVSVEVVKEVEVIVEVIKEVPVEIVKEVEVVKQIDMASLQKLMSEMGTVEISKTVVNETRTEKEASIVGRNRLDGKESDVSEDNQDGIANDKSDLKKIEGIGPKIEEILNAVGIITFHQLSLTEPDSIREILLAEGSRYKMHNPDTWPQQAKFADKGLWDELQDLQDNLNGGV